MCAECAGKRARPGVSALKHPDGAVVRHKCPATEKSGRTEIPTPPPGRDPDRAAVSNER